MSVKQKGVLKGMATGATISIVLIVAGITYNPFGYTEELNGIERLFIAFKSCTLLALFLAIAIGRLARHRFFTPEDIDGGGLSEDSTKAKLLQSLLQNTLEQSLLAMLVYTAWVVIMPATWLSVVPMAVIAFIVGRVLFFVGFSNGAPSRSLGFALTFYPSIGMLICIGVMSFLMQLN